MTVFLATPRHIPATGDYRHWCAVGDRYSTLDDSRRLPDLARRLHAAFDASADAWLALGKRLAGEPTAALAHAPACAANASDLGLMMAWSTLVGELARSGETTLVVCDDPWLYRHLAGLPGVTAGRPPILWPRACRLVARGFAARLLAAIHCASAVVRLHRHRRSFPKDASVLLVYGHPTSDADGTDGYFGDLMKQIPELVRILHVDCPPARARELAKQKRTFSLHAWGNPFAALKLVFAHWRPPGEHVQGPHGWLVRRAAALEAGTGQAAMIRWQQMCHDAWFRTARPRRVAWPWENHAWERDFVRRARKAGVTTIGYQHATVGEREWNYAPASNPDSEASLPDRIFCSGPQPRMRLLQMGHRGDGITVGGALRYREIAPLPYDPEGPVFVALPFDGVIASEMVSAIRPLGEKGRRFLVKDHPMTPFAFADSPGVARAALPLGQQDGVSVVIYAATTLGLEARLGGLPTLRFQPSACVPTDPVPAEWEVPTVTAETIEAGLDAARPPPPIDPGTVFPPPRPEIWREALCGSIEPSIENPATNQPLASGAVA